MGGSRSLPLLLLVAFLLLAGDLAARDGSVIREFRKSNPCPATGKTSGACPGWQVDHANPLCAGGEDRVHNLQWLSTEQHKWKTRSDIRLCRYKSG